MLRSPGEFAEGLTAWMRGEDTYEAEAAAVTFAEIALYVRIYIKAKFKKD